MATDSYAEERLIAELAVQRAAVLTKRVLASVSKDQFTTKPDTSPVTVADFAAQALLIAAVRHRFPADIFVGEETADALRASPPLLARVWDLVASTRLDDAAAEALLGRPASVEEMLEAIDAGGRGVGSATGRVWMLDPLDGTATFLRKEQYAVSLALVVDGREMVGVLACPNLRLDNGSVVETVIDERGHGVLLSAERGKGAVVRHSGTGALLPAVEIGALNDGPVRLQDLKFVDFSRSTTRRSETVREVAQRLGASYPGTDLWSSHMRYVALILGGCDVQLRIPRARSAPRVYVWDHAGAQLIFTEIGGKVTDLDGNEIDFGAGRQLTHNYGIVAAKRGAHSRVLKLVNELLGRSR